MFRIKYASKFVRQFKKLPVELQENYAVKEDILKGDPFDVRLRTHKLQGKLRKYWAISLTDKYRVIFGFEGKKLVVMLAIGDHGIYEKVL